MLMDAGPETFSAIYMCTGYVDLRKNIDGLCSLLTTKYRRDVYKENELYLFCGRCAYKIKGLVRENNRFVLIYMRLSEGRFHWIRDETKGILQITYSQFVRLMAEGTIE